MNTRLSFNELAGVFSEFEGEAHATTISQGIDPNISRTCGGGKNLETSLPTEMVEAIGDPPWRIVGTKAYLLRLAHATRRVGRPTCHQTPEQVFEPCTFEPR